MEDKINESEIITKQSIIKYVYRKLDFLRLTSNSVDRDKIESISNLTFGKSYTEYCLFGLKYFFKEIEMPITIKFNIEKILDIRKHDYHTNANSFIYGIKHITIYYDGVAFVSESYKDFLEQQELFTKMENEAHYLKAAQFEEEERKKNAPIIEEFKSILFK